MKAYISRPRKSKTDTRPASRAYHLEYSKSSTGSQSLRAFVSPFKMCIDIDVLSKGKLNLPLCISFLRFSMGNFEICMLTRPMLCFLWLPSAPYNNVKYFIFLSVLPSTACAVLSIQFGLFCDTRYSFLLPFIFVSFLLTRSLVIWASPSSFPSFLFTPVTDLNTSLNVGSSVSRISEHFN